MSDQYNKIWVSHSSLSDFVRCPVSYYYRNVYRNPATGRKIQIVSPSLSLGSAVHEALEPLAQLKVADRFKKTLLERLDESWKGVAGKLGGFSSRDEEAEYKRRGEEMLKLVQKDPGPLSRLTVHILAEKNLPRFDLSEADDIILCGKIDWLEYLPETDSVRVIDFKTSRKEENEASLQLPIYLLLASYTQNRPVTGVSYWYLEKGRGLVDRPLMDLEEAKEKILALAKQVKLARKLERYVCPHGDKGCRYCRPLKAVVQGKGEWVGVGGFRADLYYLPDAHTDPNQLQSEIL